MSYTSSPNLPTPPSSQSKVKLKISGDTSVQELMFSVPPPTSFNHLATGIDHFSEGVSLVALVALDEFGNPWLYLSSTYIGAPFQSSF